MVLKEIICKLDLNKVHAHDMMYDNATNESLLTIFKNWLKYGLYSDGWEKGNIVPIFKIPANKTSKTIVHCLLIQSAARYSNVSYTITCLTE